MVQAIRVHETGGPDVMRWEQVEVGEPGPGEVRIRHTAIGLNFIDTYFRSGLYPSPAGLPFSPGNEGAGIVQSVGDGVAHLNPGDRVAYAGPLGAYAQERVVPADNLVVIPDGIDDKTAAAMMLKGMTAQYLLRQTFAVGPDTTLLFHAAAGGVGLIAGQWAAHLGATVIGTAGSDEKIALAKAHGYQHMINYRTEDFVERVKEITGGKGCDVVYDSVGQDTYPGSLDCIRPLGTWVSFGQSSGPITDFNLGLLAQKGSLFATRPTLFTYIATRDALEATAGELFDVVQRGIVKIELNQEYRLANAIQAHEDLEGRKTTGTTVLIP
ncbi:quinone oxidoreductase family protein [Roseibium album]|uniref:quinone oxidoreductase family protein n=1 Tax=Roseibium album TaxID=311410 RepID=UPI0032970527